MIFLGFISFIDPAKEDVKSAIKKCREAGIQIVMVTGDHPGTAQYIAEKVKLNDKDEIDVIKGHEIGKKEENVYESNLFARVDPEQKFKIVAQFKKEGEITAMTDDGVNDAPALKKADIGIAMGERGTQIAQEVADIILKDDSFPSIVNAIESIGKGDETIMKQKPKNPEEPIINKRNWMTMAIYGSVMALIICGVYLLTFYQFGESKELANTVAFFSLAVSQLLHVFNMREPAGNIFSNQVTQNKYIWMALGLCFAVLTAAYFIPILHNILSFETLSAVQWLLVAGASFSVLIIIQIIKKIFKI